MTEESLPAVPDRTSPDQTPPDRTLPDRAKPDRAKADGAAPRYVETEPVPTPSYLPPNPSVGELVTEIDRARHDAAHTVEALVGKLDVRTRARDTVQARRKQIVAATPESVAKGVGVASQYAKRVPVPAWLGLVVALIVLRKLRKR